MRSEQPSSSTEALAADVVERMSHADHPPLTVVSGPSGIELRTVVDHMCRELGATTPRGGPRITVVHLSIREAAGDLDLTNRIPPLSVLRGKPGTVLVFRNLHWLPIDAIDKLETLLRKVAGTSTRCVCEVGLPVPTSARTALLASFDRLRRDGLVRLVTLRPVPRNQVPELVTSLIGAVPEPALRDELWSVTRGWPTVLATALRTKRDDLVAVADRHAYLTGRHGQRVVAENEELFTDIRALGPTAFCAAKAIAALAPLGEAAPRLVGEALGTTEDAAGEVLGELARAGVLQYVRSESRWRFRLPLVALSLERVFGPYERRKLARIAVNALWQGTARCEVATYLPDQLVNAGRLVDPERARAELLSAAAQLSVHGLDRSLPWLRAAAELSSDRTERVRNLLTHARASLLCGDAGSALESTDAVLRAYPEAIPPGQLVDVCLCHLTALHRSGDIATLQRVAAQQWWPWPGTEPEQAVGRAFALWLLGRWQQTRELLDEVRLCPDVSLVERYVRGISTMIGLWLGDPAEFDQDVLDLPSRVDAGEKPHIELRNLTGALVALGELRRAGPLIALSERAHVRLTTASQAALAIARGRTDEALELTRKSIATGPRNGCDADQTAMFHLAATVQLYRGKLSRALALVATARERTPALPHLLTLTEAGYERLSQREQSARSVLETALTEAEQTGVIALTDLLWTALADIAVELGERQLLADHLDRVEVVAERMGTEQAEVNRLTLRAAVHADTGAADRAVALLRERNQPLELISGLERLVRFGVAAPELLLEAYHTAGELEALMCRAWLRNLMRAHAVAVPGRQVTVAENEHLLAVLVADGLGNKQIATLLGASEKSVEGRLSRLFSRTGYRSRVELASAMLTGQFQR